MRSKDESRELAISLRKLGYSYSQIKKEVNVSKSSLSKWLENFPLSSLQIEHLQGDRSQRIEKYRDTMRTKRESEQFLFLSGVQEELGPLSRREVLLAGLFLYWGEGTKTTSYTVALTNTDPEVMKFFVRWLNLLGVKNEQMTVVLHLYEDMDIVKETEFWSKSLSIDSSQFKKPHVKKSGLCDITYKSGFKHGTCNIIYRNKNLYLYVKTGLQFIRNRP
jgi:hypothetical protein